MCCLHGEDEPRANGRAELYASARWLTRLGNRNQAHASSSVTPELEQRGDPARARGSVSERRSREAPRHGRGASARETEERACRYERQTSVRNRLEGSASSAVQQSGPASARSLARSEARSCQQPSGTLCEPAIARRCRRDDPVERPIARVSNRGQGDFPRDLCEACGHPCPATPPPVSWLGVWWSLQR